MKSTTLQCLCLQTVPVGSGEQGAEPKQICAFYPAVYAPTQSCGRSDRRDCEHKTLNAFYPGECGVWMPKKMSRHTIWKVFTVSSGGDEEAQDSKRTKRRKTDNNNKNQKKLSSFSPSGAATADLAPPSPPSSAFSSHTIEPSALSDSI